MTPVDVRHGSGIVSEFVITLFCQCCGAIFQSSRIVVVCPACHQNRQPNEVIGEVSGG